MICNEPYLFSYWRVSLELLIPDLMESRTITLKKKTYFHPPFLLTSLSQESPGSDCHLARPSSSSSKCLRAQLEVEHLPSSVALILLHLAETCRLPLRDIRRMVLLSPLCRCCPGSETRGCLTLSVLSLAVAVNTVDYLSFAGRWLGA